MSNQHHDYSAVRGPHYQADDYQHWDLVAELNLNYYEGCATKYLARYNKPTGQGVKDLKKSHTYVCKLISTLSCRGTPLSAMALAVLQALLGGEDLEPYRLTHNGLVTLDKFFTRQGIDCVMQRATIVQLCRWRSVEDLRNTLTSIQSLIAVEEDKCEASPAYVNQD